jgi:hypothetical protein
VQLIVFEIVPECLRDCRNPPGTLTPAPVRCRIISPSDAFLPPTRSTSAIDTASSATI